MPFDLSLDRYVSRYTDDIFSFAELVLGQTPADVRRASGEALSNEVWDISLGNTSCILRLCRSEQIATYRKEAWCIPAAAEVGIPSAQVLGYDVLNGTAWMVQSKIEGTVGSQWGGNPLDLWRELGRLSAKLHEIPVCGYGGDILPDNEANKIAVRGWGEWLEDRLNYLFKDDGFIQSRLFTFEQNKIAKDRLTELYRLEYSPVLTHMDLTPKNSIICPNKGVHVIDYDGAGGGFGLISELATISTFDNKPNVVKAFCQGYGVSAEQFELLQPALEQASLMRALTHMRWIVDHPEQDVRYFEEARNKCLEIVGPDQSLAEVLSMPIREQLMQLAS